MTMPHQKLLFMMIRVGLITTIATLGWNFPLQEVAKPECRGMPRSQLDDDCKIDIVDGSHDNTIGSLLFSALRGTSYRTSRTPNSGGHPSLDMPTSAGTPVYAIQDGVVMNASERAGYGLSITIRHTFNDTVIFSNYSHLDEILIRNGQQITKGQQIGMVGCTGFSISGDPTRCGNHLDFQLTTDKSPSHPYGYGDCGNYMVAVNEGTCREKMQAFTIDPLVFFAQQSDIRLNYPLIAGQAIPVQHSSAPPANDTRPRPSLQDIFARLRAQNSAILGGDSSTPPASQTEQPKPTRTPLPQINSSLATVVEAKPSVTPPQQTASTKNEAPLHEGTLRRAWNSDIQNVPSLKIITLTLGIADDRGNPFVGKISQPLTIRLDNEAVGSIFPSTLREFNTNQKHLFLQTRLPGTTVMTIRYGDKKIAEQTIIVK